MKTEAFLNDFSNRILVSHGPEELPFQEQSDYHNMFAGMPLEVAPTL